MDIISKTLSYIGKKNTNAFVVQIGAMDGINFDDTRAFLDMFKWPALLVEPIPEIFTELRYNFRDRENYIFEQSAITDYDGEVEILTIPKIAIEKENLHPGYRGMSAIYPLKNGFGSTYQRDIDVKEKFGINITVPSLSFESLLNKHKITNFDILICDVEGYDWHILKQLDFNKYRPKFIRLEYINLTDEEKRLTEEKLINNGYVVEIRQDIDAVDKNLWEEINKETNQTQPNFDDILQQIKQLSFGESTELLKILTEYTSKVNVSNTELTIVTGLWNINRVGRDFSSYIENFKKFLEIPINMFIYIPKEYEHIVWEKRSTKNTYVRLYELDDVKRLYSPFWEKTQEIRTNDTWINQTGETGWLKNSPQATNEWYNPIVQSKMFMLHDAKVLNPFNTDYFLWLDAGITNTVYEKYFTDNDCFDKILPHLKTFLFLSYPYEAVNEIHGFDFNAINRYARQKVTYVCRGGLFGGHKDFISQANSTYYALLQQTLTDGYMGTEESIFSIMAHLDPHIYRRYTLDDNGLIVKFIQALIDDTVVLEDVGERSHVLPKGYYNESTTKTSLYVLSFNFPEQFKTLLESFEKHPEWLEKPRKILINNSQDGDVIDQYDILCKQYGFEHIVTGKNLGINRGRLYAATHFQESDSDYYFFFEDDMSLHSPENTGYCRNGFRQYVPNLYRTVHEIMAKEEFDFLKLSYTEVYMDNNIQVSWYNIPQTLRSTIWPNYDVLPVSGLDPNAPRTKFDKIDVHNWLSYISGDIYYANWPMIVSKKGNYKMFLETTWENPYEQTWMSYMFQETLKGNIKPAVLLASPINHNRIHHYTPEERREN